MWQGPTGGGRVVDGESGNGAFAVSGRSWEVEFALPRRGRVRDDSGRRLGGAGGFGPNLSIVVSSVPRRETR
jgi:hypothetical protein